MGRLKRWRYFRREDGRNKAGPGCLEEMRADYDV